MRCEIIEAHKDGVVINCPACAEKSLIPGAVITTIDGATFNCFSCSELLVGIKHAGVYVSVPLHKWINRSEPQWPADGVGTRCIDIPYDERDFECEV